MRLYSVCAFRKHELALNLIGFEYLSRTAFSSPFFLSLHDALAFLSLYCDLSLPWTVNDGFNSIVARSAEV